jgi:dGTPase
LRSTLGHNNSEIVNTLVNDIVQNSTGRDAIAMSERIGRALQRLIEINVDRIYKAPRVKRYENQVRNVLEGLFEYYLQCAEQGEPNSKEMPSVAFWEYVERHPEQDADPLRIVTDYIAGMTDPYANRMFNTIYGM